MGPQELCRHQDHKVPAMRPPNQQVQPCPGSPYPDLPRGWVGAQGLEKSCPVGAASVAPTPSGAPAPRPIFRGCCLAPVSVFLPLLLFMLLVHSLRVGTDRGLYL